MQAPIRWIVIAFFRLSNRQHLFEKTISFSKACGNTTRMNTLARRVYLKQLVEGIGYLTNHHSPQHAVVTTRSHILLSTARHANAHDSRAIAHGRLQLRARRKRLPYIARKIV